MTLTNTDFLNNVLNLLAFLGLCFLGVTGRLSYDVEVKNKRYKLSNFFNRFFIATIFTYIIEIYIVKNKLLREYYTQIILAVSFLSIDIINFIIKYKDKLFIYVLNIFAKGTKDMLDNFNNKDKINE